MTFFLDTNVISELCQPAHVADNNVTSWAAGRKPSEMFISVITVLEIEIGIGRLERRDRTQAQRLRTWLEDRVLVGFSGRILPVDLPIIRRAAAMHVPNPRPERDVLIAAIAVEREMTVVTHNLADFQPLGVTLFDPWLP